MTLLYILFLLLEQNIRKINMIEGVTLRNITIGLLANANDITMLRKNLEVKVEIE